MYCLHCGDCCLRMSPLSAPEPCPHLINIGTFYFCDSYECRPEECIKHDFPAHVCPIGCSILNIQNAEQKRYELWSLEKDLPGAE